MTTTLTAAQSADPDADDYRLASLAAAGPRAHDFLIQIGDELEYVEWRGDQFARPWQVIRGYLGTTPAAHLSGATVTVEPTIGGSSGGGVNVDNGVAAIPAEVDITGPDAIGNDILKITAPAGYHQTTGDGYLIHAFAGDGTDILNFDPSGSFIITSAVEEGPIPAQFQLANGSAAGETTTIRAGRSGGTTDRLTMGHGSVVIFRVLVDGGIVTASNAAPVDAQLSAGQMALWFDQTNGAAKLMIKAKSANGTVVTGSVNLS